MSLPVDTGYTKLTPPSTVKQQTRSKTKTLGRSTAPPLADSKNRKEEEYERIEVGKGGKKKKGRKGFLAVWYYANKFFFSSIRKK